MNEPEAVEVCSVDDLALGEARRFVIGETPVCLVRVRDGFRAIFDVCSHENYPLSDGEVELDEGLIECVKHGSMFSLETGEPMSFPATQPVPVFVVEIDHDRVRVRLS